MTVWTRSESASVKRRREALRLAERVRVPISAAMMKHFYRDVPGLGHVAVSRHAQAQMEAAGISQEQFDRALLKPVRPDVFEGQDILWRERDGLRIVILANPQPFRGAKLVKTVFRVQEQARSIH